MGLRSPRGFFASAYIVLAGVAGPRARIFCVGMVCPRSRSPHRRPCFSRSDACMQLCNLLIGAGLPWALVRIAGLLYLTGFFGDLPVLVAAEYFAGRATIVRGFSLLGFAAEGVEIKVACMEHCEGVTCPMLFLPGVLHIRLLRIVFCVFPVPVTLTQRPQPGRWHCDEYVIPCRFLVQPGCRSEDYPGRFRTFCPGMQHLGVGQSPQHLAQLHTSVGEARPANRWRGQHHGCPCCASHRPPYWSRRMGYDRTARI